MIREVTDSDTAALCAIYNHYIANGIATFEEQVLDTQTLRERIAQVCPGLPWLVCEADGEVAGYAYASPWRTRSAYRFSVESTIYLDPRSTGRGLGTQLYEALLGALRAQSLHVVVSAIALPNPASVALHEKMGFEKVAHLKEVGRKFGRWIDVGYWELLLE